MAHEKKDPESLVFARLPGLLFSNRKVLLPEQTLICEDALYAVRAASEAGANTGAKVLAFRDIANTGDWEKIRALAVKYTP